ncbi:hypothetical protein K3Z88_12960 [Pseudomonas aeruginosa]|nr:hypothetical protein [Pseudomonas aeruginosa]
MKRAAHAQDIYLHIDDSLVGHLAEEAYQPEFGARELKRQIRQQLETRLATAMLKGEVKEGETVTFFYDAKDGVGYRKGAAPKPAARKKSGAGETPKGRATAARKPAAKKGAAAKGKADKPKTK